VQRIFRITTLLWIYMQLWGDLQVVARDLG
jgi:hypothetical protein